MNKSYVLRDVLLTALLVIAMHLHHNAVQARQASTDRGASAVASDQPRLVVQLGHSGGVNSVAISSNDRFILTGSSDHSTCLWEAATGLEIRRFEGHSSGVNSVIFSPDGSLVLTGSADKTARLWDAETGEEVRRFEGHRSTVLGVAFSPDGRFVLTGGNDKTARLWDATIGKELFVLNGHSSDVRSVAFSPDGHFALTGSDDRTARLWSVANGQEIRRFGDGNSFISAVAFSPDARLVLTWSSTDTNSLQWQARLWNVSTGQEVRRFDAGEGFVNSAQFSPDGRYILTVSVDGTARLWKTGTGESVRYFEGHSSRVACGVFSHDGRLIVTGGEDHTARLWDPTTGEQIQLFVGDSSVSRAAFSLSGRFVITGRNDGAHIWDVATGEMRHLERGLGAGNTVGLSSDGRFVVVFAAPALTGRKHGIVRVIDNISGREIQRFEGSYFAISPNNRFVLTLDRTRPESDLPPRPNFNLRLWDIASGQEVWHLAKISGFLPSASFSPDSRLLLIGSPESVQLWDAATGKEVRRFEETPGSDFPGPSVSFSPDGQSFLTVGFNGMRLQGATATTTVRLRDVITGREIWRIDEREDRTGWPFLKAAAFSPDGRLFFTEGSSGDLSVRDSLTGKELRRLAGFGSFVTSTAFTSDGRFIMTSAPNGTVRLWNVSDSSEACRLVSLRNGSWVILDPEGRYDASDGGEIQGLHWVVGNEAIALAQLKERYYEPGLFSKIIGFNKELLRNVSAFKGVRLFPSVEYEAPAPGSARISIRLTNRGGGIGKARVLVNGKELDADARGLKTVERNATKTISVDLAGAPIIPGVPNSIEVIAWNAEGYLSSRPIKREWIPRGEAASRAPELYAIVGGISRYASPDLMLRFAAKDAEAMAKAIEIGARRLFGVEKVHLTLLSTSTDQRAISPTKANFRKAFEAARRAKPWDLVVVYLAGHAVALPGGNDMYCYLTQEGRSSKLDDPAIRSQTTITSDELVDWIKQIPALKQVMVLDTCQAGAAATRLIEKRDVPSDQIRAIERLKDRTGFHILMGSAADAVSYEASKYGQGLLTYSLLQGMRGAALRDGEYVDVSKLFQYAADQVPQLARNIGGIQKPLIAAPRGTSFDIGQLKKEDKGSIPLAMVMPMILRPLFLNPEQGFDNLELIALVRKRLQEESYPSTRSGLSLQTVVFVDADELPGAIRPSGTYTVEGENIRANLFLIRDSQRVANFQVEGSKNDPTEIVLKIVEGIKKAIRKL